MCQNVICRQRKGIPMKEQTYTLRASVGPEGGGHINRAGRILVYPGEDVTITFFPHPGYRVSQAEIDGRSAGPVPSCSFQDIHEDHTLLVHFAPIESRPAEQLLHRITQEGAVITGVRAGAPFDLTIPGEIDGQPVIGIESGAFQDNSNILSLHVPDGVTRIGQDAFSGCSALLRFRLPETLRELGANAFRGCTSLAEIILPKGFTGSIGAGAFADCASAVCANIPEGTTDIRDDAFAGDRSLRKLYFNGVSRCRVIGRRSFAGCAALEDIILPPDLVSLAGDAFAVTGLKDCIFTGQPFPVRTGSQHRLTLHVRSDYINDFAARTRDIPEILLIPLDDDHETGPDGNLYRYTINDNAESVTINGVLLTGSADLLIPGRIRGLPVSGLGDRCFKSMGDIILAQRPIMPGTDIRSAVLPDGLKEIGKEAFYACTGLESVRMPDTVTTIGSGAFCNCYSLKHINLSTALEGSLPDIVFWGCLALEDVRIPEGIHAIARWTFYNCQSLTRIDFPASICSIDKESFEQCTSLKKVTFPPDSLCTSFGQQVFWNDLSLEEIILPPGLTFLGVEALKNASGLKKISIPKTVRSMGAGVFSGCASLEQVTFEGCIAYIDEHAFTGCDRLKTLRLPAGSSTKFHKNAFSSVPNIEYI